MGKIELNWQQKELVNELTSYLNSNVKEFFGVYGAGGTGKTTAILESIKEPPSKIIFLGATNKVCNILKSGFRKKGIDNYEIRTIDSFLNFKMEKDHNNQTVTKRKLPKVSDIPPIIIIDECSMINDESVPFILKLKKYSKVILIGDEMQIPPVTVDGQIQTKRNAQGFKVSSIFNHIENSYTLTIQNRQKEESELFSLINGFRNNMDKRIDFVRMAELKQNGKDILYYDDYNNKDFKKHLYGNDFISVGFKNLTCLTFNWLIGSTKSNNKGYKVSELNIGDKVLFDSYYKKDKETRFYTSEIVDIIDKEENVKRTFGIDGFIVEYSVDVLRVKNEVESIFDIDVSRGQKETISKIYYRLQKGREKRKKQIENTTNNKYKWAIRKEIAKLNTLYSDFRLGLAKLKKPYAITSHKSQGSTYGDIIIPLYDFYSRYPQDANQLMYVAMSRASKRVIFVNKKSQFRNNSNRYHFTELERSAIASNQNWKCKGVILGNEYEGGRKDIGCGIDFNETRDFEVDHIKRLEDGGSNNPTNLQTLCKKCHKQKTLTEKTKEQND